MGIAFEGRIIETTPDGHLVDAEAWSRDLALHMAKAEGLTLGPRHWDVIAYLRDEYFNDDEETPSAHALQRAMGRKWGEKVETRTLAALFPQGAAAQGARLAGLPADGLKGGA